MRSITGRWSYISKHSYEKVLNVISLVLNSTYCTSNLTIDILNKSLVCPWVSFITDPSKFSYSRLRKVHFANINIDIRVYFRYVNDILLAVPNNQIYEILDKFTNIR